MLIAWVCIVHVIMTVMHYLNWDILPEWQSSLTLIVEGPMILILGGLMFSGIKEKRLRREEETLSGIRDQRIKKQNNPTSRTRKEVKRP